MHIAFKCEANSYNKQANSEKQGCAIHDRTFTAVSQSDTVSFAGKSEPFFSREELKKALGLSIYANEEEFQRARVNYIIEIVRDHEVKEFDQAEIEEMKKKSFIIDHFELEPHLSKAEIKKWLEKNYQDSVLSKDQLHFTRALLLAYKHAHPFEHPGTPLVQKNDSQTTRQNGKSLRELREGFLSKLNQQA